MLEQITKAGLSADEFAKIVGVSRVAVFNWKAKRTKPHPQIAPKVRRAEEFISKLVALKKLPLSKDLSREERKTKVERLRDAFEKYN